MEERKGRTADAVVDADERFVVEQTQGSCDECNGLQGRAHTRAFKDN